MGTSHFIGIRLSESSDIVGRAESLQNELIGESELTCLAFTKLQRLHITLAVLRVEENTNVVETFRASGISGKIPILVSHVGSFGNNVVFLGLEPNPDLNSLAFNLEAKFRHFLFKPSNSRFNPHITILKTSQISKPEYKRSIQACVTHFMSEIPATFEAPLVHLVDRIDLCCMKSAPPKDGYYEIVESLYL